MYTIMTPVLWQFVMRQTFLCERVEGGGRSSPFRTLERDMGTPCGVLPRDSWHYRASRAQWALCLVPTKYTETAPKDFLA